MAENSGSFGIKVNGLEELKRLFEKAPEVATPILEQALERSKGIIDSNRIDPKNIPWITGELARRWSTQYGKLTIRTKPDVEYAQAVQFGMPASPGRFVPAIGKRLVDPSLPHFGTWPGFQGRHFMEKIVDASRSQINTVFKNALRAITKELANQ